MSNALFLIPVLVVLAALVFRRRLFHVARSLHHAQQEYRQPDGAAARNRDQRGAVPPNHDQGPAEVGR